VSGVGDVEDERLDTRRTDGISVTLAADASEDVKPSSGKVACDGCTKADSRTGDDRQLANFR
jgi:hypothetical protein